MNRPRTGLLTGVRAAARTRSNRPARPGVIPVPSRALAGGDQYGARSRFRHGGAILGQRLLPIAGPSRRDDSKHARVRRHFPVRRPTWLELDPKAGRDRAMAKV